MNPEFVKRRLTEQEELREKTLSKNFIKREVQNEASKLLLAPLIKAIIGPRRAGKTTLGMLLLKDKEFYYANFDDEILSSMKASELGFLLEYWKELLGNRKIIFLDEIQNIKSWELFVNRIHRLDYNVIITGSNSKLLSRELSTHLGGRVLSIELLPFSFREFLKLKNISVNETDEGIGLLKRKVKEYITSGSFPEVLIDKFKGELRTKYYSEIFRTVVERDITQRHKLKYPSEINALALLLMDYFSARVSFTKLSHELDIGVHTVKKYIQYLEEAYLFLTSKKFSFKPKESELSIRKIYCIDTGLIGSFRENTTKDFGRLMENIVAIELKRKGFNLYYYLAQRIREVDFVVKSKNKIKYVIQVVYDNEFIPEREVKNGLLACKELNCRRLLIITWNKESEEKKGKVKISYVPLWKFLTTLKIKT